MYVRIQTGAWEMSNRNNDLVRSKMQESSLPIKHFDDVITLRIVKQVFVVLK